MVPIHCLGIYYEIVVSVVCFTMCVSEIGSALSWQKDDNYTSHLRLETWSGSAITHSGAMASRSVATIIRHAQHMPGGHRCELFFIYRKDKKSIRVHVRKYCCKYSFLAMIAGKQKEIPRKNWCRSISDRRCFVMGERRKQLLICHITCL